MFSFMSINRNVPLINGNATNPFFSYASYVKYSVPPETVATAGQKNHLQQKFSDSATEASSQLDFNLLAKEEPHEKSPGHQSTGSHATSATDRKMYDNLDVRYSCIM